MKNTYIFLRHGETIKDPTIHPKEWKLTPEALTVINKYLDLDIIKQVNYIYSSTENKSVTTLKPIATFLSKKIIEVSNFVEIGRSPKFLSDKEFLIQKKRQLTEYQTEVDGGESAEHALNRFKEGIEQIEKTHSEQMILIGTHGTILSLYFANILNQMDQTYERWSKLPFCAYGVIRNDKVEKDIT